MAGYSSPEPASGGLRRQVWGAIVFLLIAGVVFSLPQTGKERFAAVLRNSILAPFIGLNTALADARSRAVKTTELRAVADSLTARLQSRNVLEEENRRLRDLLLLSGRLGPTWLADEAVRPGTQGAESTFFLDLGARDGVRERAPVVTREGLVGVVRELGPTASVAMDWSHPEFAASAMTADGTTYGIVESRRGAFREQDRLVLLSTPYNTVLDSGTVVLTSGRGGTFPRGIAIGRIDGVLGEEGGFERNYTLTPFVDPGEATLVLVQARGASDGSEGGGGTGAMVESTGRADSVADVSRGWPAQSWMRANERARAIPVWQDSVRMLRDSVSRLLGTPPDTTAPETSAPDDDEPATPDVEVSR
ncbi:MAG TPA: rod shape-determining protein MreC [Longimicrobiales bacterium]|nr:rod shape-determining protein MreC [Longimicrobiales bacterium]